MPKESFSFDIVSEADLQEVDNAVNQAKKELAQRFDFKGSKSSLEYNRAEKKLTLVGDNDFKLNSIRDMLANKLAKRGVSMKFLTFKDPEQVFGGCLQQIADLASGIPQDKAKEIVKAVKEQKLKANVSIQSDTLRVSSKSKDELQNVMAFLRGADFGIALQFDNFR